MITVRDTYLKKLINNRPEYTKLHNELITVKWNNAPDKRRWEINLSGEPIFTNNTNSINVPTGQWKQINNDNNINIVANLLILKQD